MWVKMLVQTLDTLAKCCVRGLPLQQSLLRFKGFYTLYLAYYITVQDIWFSIAYSKFN